MSGVLHFYFTLLISITKNKNMESKLGFKRAWQWISDVLNLTPRPNVTAEILTIFFKCCGHQLQYLKCFKFNLFLEIYLFSYFKNQINILN